MKPETIKRLVEAIKQYHKKNTSPLEAYVSREYLEGQSDLADEILTIESFDIDKPE